MKIADIKKLLSERRMRILKDFSSDLDFFDSEHSNNSIDYELISNEDINFQKKND